MITLLTPRLRTLLRCLPPLALSAAVGAAAVMAAASDRVPSASVSQSGTFMPECTQQCIGTPLPGPVCPAAWVTGDDEPDGVSQIC